MDLLFLGASYQREVSLLPATVKFLQENRVKTVALYASTQFSNRLDLIKKQLKKLKIKVISSRPERAHGCSQLLGCDVFSDSLHLSLQEKAKIDYYLYIGDGKFHPLTLLFAQKDLSQMKEIICNDSINHSLHVLGLDHVKKILRRYRGSLMKFLSAQEVGVIVTIKPGQEQFKFSLSLEKKYPQKKFYYFIDNNVSFDQLENFLFISIWVNTACPRIALDDQDNFRQGVINLNDALRAGEILSKKSLLNQSL